MAKFLEHKGYFGSVDFDLDEGYVFGRLLFIRDVVSYRADDLKSVRAAFAAAVDDYLETCRELGEAPDTPCKGSFNVRLGADLHQDAALDAHAEDVSLNEWMKDACRLKLDLRRSGNAAAVPAVTRAQKPVLRVEGVFVEEQQIFEADWQSHGKSFH